MIQGKVNFISARLPCPLLLLAAGLNYYYVAQVSSSADEAKITITGTGTYLADGPVTVAARALRPSARPSEGDRCLPRAQVSSPTTEIKVSYPGKAAIAVPQGGGVEDITFKCYGVDVTVLDGESAVCPPPTAALTAKTLRNGLP